MSKPKYYDAMVKDWLFWCQLARDLSVEVYGLKAEATANVERGQERLLGDSCEKVFEALCIVRREKACVALEWAIRGKTVRQIQKVMPGVSQLDISEELDWACNRLITLAKDEIEVLVLTLQ
ncbi:MAG: hypothetical protein CGW95_00925 [Phenylobacterium zucineum]|nr:MAG: hypothetical protein CGW95_00925 [Phenylobacterium zucineum]